MKLRAVKKKMSVTLSSLVAWVAWTVPAGN